MVPCLLTSTDLKPVAPVVSISWACFTGRMPFLSPNQSFKALNGKLSHSMDLLTPSSPGVFQLCPWPLIAPGNLGGGLPCLSTALCCQYPTNDDYCYVITITITNICTDWKNSQQRKAEEQHQMKTHNEAVLCKFRRHFCREHPLGDSLTFYNLSLHQFVDQNNLHL